MSLRDEIAATVHRAYPEGVNGWYIADLLTETLQPKLAEAWDEGWDTRHESYWSGDQNPYRDNPSKDGED